MSGHLAKRAHGPLRDPLRDEANLHVEEDGELGVTRGRFVLRSAFSAVQQSARRRAGNNMASAVRLDSDGEWRMAGWQHADRRVECPSIVVDAGRGGHRAHWVLFVCHASRGGPRVASVLLCENEPLGRG